MPEAETSPEGFDEARPRVADANEAMATLRLIATEGNEEHRANVGLDVQRTFHNFSVAQNGLAAEGTARLAEDTSHSDNTAPTGQKQSMDVDSDEHDARTASNR